MPQAKDMYLKTLDKSLSCSDGREYVLRNYLEQIPEHAEVTRGLILEEENMIVAEEKLRRIGRSSQKREERKD